MKVQRNLEQTQKVFHDLYSGIVPERFPVWDVFAPEYMVAYAGYDMVRIQYEYTPELFEEIIEKIMEVSRGDTFEVGYLRNAVQLMFQRSNHFVMAPTGFIQHPEVSFMKPEEYDAFIENPYDYVLENIFPRIYSGYGDDKISTALNFAKVIQATKDQSQGLGGAQKKVFDKYGMYTPPAGTTGGLVVPFDKIADSYRSFSQINYDIRRCPEKLLDACEALMPYTIWANAKITPSVEGYAAVKTHMGAFLSYKQFEKFYWPTFYKGAHISAERGVDVDYFLESDWERFIPLLQDLPQGTRMYMEGGDPKAFKDALGKKMVLGGFYPLSVLRSGTKEQVVDKAKEIVDIMAPGGNFYFRYSQSAYILQDFDLENYAALHDWIQENNKYDNAGAVSMPGDKKASIVEGLADQYPAFKSKYIQSFEDFKQKYPYVYPACEDVMEKVYDKYTKAVQGFIGL